MDRILIRGGNRLSGRLKISGAKNAALTLMPCAILTDEPVTLRNLPRLADVDGFGHLLNQIGASTRVEGTRLSMPTSAMRTSPLIWMNSSPRLSVTRFCPWTSMVPLGNTCATVTLISPDSELDWSAAPEPLKLRLPPMPMSVDFSNEPSGPVSAG